MPSPALESALVRILRIEGELRRPVGAGFLVTPKHILTCAHVVNTALGRKQYAADQPDAEIFLDFPLLRATILHWFPVQENAAVGDREDIAVLQLLSDIPLPGEAQPAPLVLPHDQSFFGGGSNPLIRLFFSDILLRHYETVYRNQMPLLRSRRPCEERSERKRDSAVSL